MFGSFIKMITEKTLFILGAGAHVPYGFPDAKGLKTKIISESTNQRLYLYNKTISNGSEFERQVIKSDGQKFTNEFNNSGIYSIDLFLSLRNEFKNQGKWAIINSILSAENEHKRSRQYNLDDWLLYLYNNMVAGISSNDQKDDFYRNNVGFLTFNYDRMIEHYFERYLSATFNLSGEMLFDYFNFLNIKHIYGSIAPLRSQLKEKIILDLKIKIIEYGQEIRLFDLEKVTDNIKIINEERNTENGIEDFISKFDRIFFLGFSYADENLQILNIPHCLRKGQTVFGTAFQNSPFEINKIRRKFYGTAWMSNSDKDLIIKPVDNLTLLKDYL